MNIFHETCKKKKTLVALEEFCKRSEQDLHSLATMHWVCTGCVFPQVTFFFCVLRTGRWVAGFKRICTYLALKKKNQNIGNWRRPLTGCSAFITIRQIRTCQQCLRRKPSFRSTKSELHPIPVAPFGSQAVRRGLSWPFAGHHPWQSLQTRFYY